LERILEYTWPGNIRELENAIESACALATGLVIDVDDLPDELRSRPALATAGPGIRPLRDVEREYILAALQHNGGNRRQTAEQLRIATATLFRKLREYTTDAAA
jgi:DNA-binding NtrC family response regulator